MSARELSAICGIGYPRGEGETRLRFIRKLGGHQSLDDVTANLDEMLIKIAEANVQELQGASPPTA
jgi:hypothetical protein